MRRGLIAAAILAMLAPSAATQGRQDGTAAAIAERLRTYLQELEPRLGALVAEERFEQILTPISGEGSSVGLSARRLLVSEIGFVRLADEHAWLGHRRVQIVDGRPVRREAPQLQDLFTRTGPEQLAAARRIAAENSRYDRP